MRPSIAPRGDQEPIECEELLTSITPAEGRRAQRSRGGASPPSRPPTAQWRLAQPPEPLVRAVVQAQQEAAAAPAVVSRRRARRLGPSAALVEGARRISFWGFLGPRLGVRVFAGRAHCAQPGMSLLYHV